MLRAPSISWLTICPLGQPEKAIGFEPQIELWLALCNRTACRIRTRRRRHDSNMTLRKKRTPGASLNYVGWRAWQTSLLLPVAGEVFPLTLPFIERRYRKIGVLVPEMSSVPSIAENQNGAAKGGLLGSLPFGRHLLSHREKEHRVPPIHSTQETAESIQDTCVLA